MGGAARTECVTPPGDNEKSRRRKRGLKIKKIKLKLKLCLIAPWNGIGFGKSQIEEIASLLICRFDFF
jgi:hypothetical protein